MFNLTTVGRVVWIYCHKLISPYIPNLYDVLKKTKPIPLNNSSKLMNFKIILTENVRELTTLVLVIIYRSYKLGIMKLDQYPAVFKLNSN